MSERRRIVRSEQDRVIGGVCQGLAEYLNIDVTLIRFIFIVLALANLTGVFIYFVLWLLIPSTNTQGLETDEVIRLNIEDVKSRMRGLLEDVNFPKTTSFWGIILIALGVVFAFKQFAPAVDSGVFFPALMILVGVYILITRLRN